MFFPFCPYKTTNKIVVYFTFFESRQKTRDPELSIGKYAQI
jgi:hypothetical protein